MTLNGGKPHGKPSEIYVARLFASNHDLTRSFPLTENTWGTLEDILFPLFYQGQRSNVTKASSFVDDLFTWDETSQKPEVSVAEKARRIKSIITIIGQRMKPGSSMNVVLDQGNLVSKEEFASNANISRFASFLREFGHFS